MNNDPDVEKLATNNTVEIVQLATASATLCVNGQLPPFSSVPSGLTYVVVASVP